MKRNSLAGKLLLTASLCWAMCSAALAKDFSDCLFFHPYVGGEYQYIHIAGSGDYHHLLPASYQSAALFAGAKIHKNIGFEIGSYRSIKTSQADFTFYSFNNVPDIGPTTTMTRQTFKGFSVDLDLYYALDPKFNVYALVGLMTMHPTLSVVATNGAGNLTNALPLITGQNKTVPRLGMGVEYCEQHWGIRSRVIWVNTQKMRVNLNNAQKYYPSLGPRAYLQSIQVTAGLFFIF
jgi:hypothetical protein